MNFFKTDKLWFSLIISTSLSISNATEKDPNQAIETRTSIIKSQDEAYEASLFEDSVTKDSDRIKLEEQLNKAEGDLKATEDRLKQFPNNQNLISLHSDHLKIFNDAKAEYDNHYESLIKKFNSARGLNEQPNSRLEQKDMRPSRENNPSLTTLNLPMDIFFHSLFPCLDEQSLQSLARTCQDLNAAVGYSKKMLFQNWASSFSPLMKKNKKLFKTKASQKVIQDVFNETLKSQGFTLIPKNLPHVVIPPNGVRLTLKDVKAQQKTLLPLCQKLFNQPLQVDRLKDQVRHLWTACNWPFVYVEAGEKASAVKKFLEAYQNHLSLSVPDSEAQGNYFSYHADLSSEEKRMLAEKPHRIIVTQEQLLRHRADLDQLFQNNSEHFLVLSVGKNLTNGKLSFDARMFPFYLKKLIIADSFDQVQEIAKHFLFQYTGLTHLKLSGFSNVLKIESGFLSLCSGLTDLDLPAFPKVTEIGDEFLSGCYGLTDLDLSGFSNVTRIGYDFLKECHGLTDLDLSGLSNVTQIGDNFVNECHGLTHLKLSGFFNVTRIGDNFVNECHGLTHLDLSDLSNVTRIGYRFFSKCYGLTHLKLSGVFNVTQIGYGFLKECHGLKHLKLSGFSNVTLIEDDFLSGCYDLTHLNLSGFLNVAKIGHGFLKECHGLTDLDLSGFSNVIQIGDSFLSECYGLRSIRPSNFILPLPEYGLEEEDVLRILASLKGSGDLSKN